MGNNRLTFETLVSSIQQIHDQLATQATKAVNVSLTLRNWMIGLYIAEFELRGADRANYGDQLFSALAKQLTSLKVSNSNRRQLYRYLRFYKLYPEIVGTLSPQLRRLLPIETRSIQKVGTPSPQLLMAILSFLKHRKRRIACQ